MNNRTKIYQTDKGWREVNPHRKPKYIDQVPYIVSESNKLWLKFERETKHYPCPELENTKEGETVEAVLVCQTFKGYPFNAWTDVDKETDAERWIWRLVTPKSETEKGEAPTPK